MRRTHGRNYTEEESNVEIAELLPPLIKGRFIARPNRFLALVELAGQEERAHVADPGRLKELLVPGAGVYVAPAERPGRRTAYDLRLVEGPAGLVAVDSRVPNRLVGRALAAGIWPEFAGYACLKEEPHAGGGRFDFLLTGGRRPDCYIEVKGCTLVADGTALFPDAPTARGARHVRELAALAQSGRRAAVVFVIQRADATAFRPHAALDPLFTAELREAAAKGVEVRAFRCRVSTAAIALDREVPICL
ncbi:MAG: sugar fermentation stimulation protein [Bacillota bacterium]|nr:sugar fermentation stimulation protein [Bacillota bacterium]